MKIVSSNCDDITLKDNKQFQKLIFSTKLQQKYGTKQGILSVLGIAGYE
jgi:hypothetical protein